LFSDSMIDQATIRAYRETEYRVQDVPAFILRIDVASAALQEAHRRCGATCSAFLTACNPFSHPCSPEDNASRQTSLLSEIQSMNLECVPGIGQHPGNGWPGEESFLIFGLDLKTARSLGVRFEQNALIWSDSDAVPQLILLR
jgi:hypothetical protein